MADPNHPPPKLTRTFDERDSAPNSSASNAPVRQRPRVASPTPTPKTPTGSVTAPTEQEYDPAEIGSQYTVGSKVNPDGTVVTEGDATVTAGDSNNELKSDNLKSYKANTDVGLSSVDARGNVIHAAKGVLPEPQSPLPNWEEDSKVDAKHVKGPCRHRIDNRPDTRINQPDGKMRPHCFCELYEEATGRLSANPKALATVSRNLSLNCPTFLELVSAWPAKHDMWLAQSIARGSNAVFCIDCEETQILPLLDNEVVGEVETGDMHCRLCKSFLCGECLNAKLELRVLHPASAQSSNEALELLRATQGFQTVRRIGDSVEPGPGASGGSREGSAKDGPEVRKEAETTPVPVKREPSSGSNGGEGRS